MSKSAIGLLNAAETTATLNHYSLAVTIATFALTLLPNSLERGYKVPVSVSTFSQTNNNANFLRTYKNAQAVGTFSAQGQSNALKYGRIFPVASASFTETFNSNILSRGYNFPISAASFSQSNSNQAFGATRKIDIGVHNYAINYSDQSLFAARFSAVQSQSYSTSFSDVAFAYASGLDNYSLDVSTTALSLSGITQILSKGSNLKVYPASFRVAFVNNDGLETSEYGNFKKVGPYKIVLANRKELDAEIKDFKKLFTEVI